MSWTVITADQLQNYYKNYANYQQANPWDTNPPLGSTPNIVWPQNQSPFMTQGGAAPWPHYNQQSLYPQFLAGHGLPTNHITNQPFGRLHTYNHWPESNITKTNSDTNENNSASQVAGGSPLTVCPCCGNMTINSNIRPEYRSNTVTNSQSVNANTDVTGSATNSACHYSSHNNNQLKQQNPKASHSYSGSQKLANLYLDNYLKQLNGTYNTNHHNQTVTSNHGVTYPYQNTFTQAGHTTQPNTNATATAPTLSDQPSFGHHLGQHSQQHANMNHKMVYDAYMQSLQKLAEMQARLYRNNPQMTDYYGQQKSKHKKTKRPLSTGSISSAANTEVASFSTL